MLELKRRFECGVQTDLGLDLFDLKDSIVLVA